jgi:hypothetical protein
MAGPTPEQLKEINKLLEIQNSYSMKITAQQQAMQESMGQIVNDWQKEVELAGNMAQAQQQMVTMLETHRATQQRILENQRIELENKKLSGQLSVEEYQQENELLNVLEEANKLRGAARKEMLEQVKTQLEANRLVQLHNEYLHEQTDLAKSLGQEFAQQVGIQGDINKTIAGRLTALPAALDLALKEGEGWKSVADYGFGAVVTMTEKLIVQQDLLVSEFVKSTGAGRELGGALLDASENMRRLGLDLTLAGPAFTSLYNNVTLFKNASAESQTVMATFTAQMSQLGVASDTTANNLQTLTNALNMTQADAQSTLAEFTNLAEGLNMSVEQMMSDFETFAGTLVQYGDQAKQVFVELQSQSRATGVAVGELINISAQFDTFTGAADAVGRLNGMLGGPYLNSIDMVYKTESERIDALRETIELSGQSWDAMSRFEQKAFAAAAGVQDLNEAAKLFGTSATEFEKNRAEAEMLASVEAELAEKSKAATDMMTNLKNAVMGLAIGFEPLITVVRYLIESLSWFLNLGGGVVSWFITITGLAMALTSAKAALLAKTLIEIPLKIKEIALAKLMTLAKTMEVNAHKRGWMTRKQSIFYSLKQIGIRTIEIAQDWLAVASKSSLAVAIGSAATATWAWTAALLANPITGIVLGVMALAAAVVGLIVHWDKLTAGVKSLTGGFLDMWDVLLLIGSVALGPVSLLVLVGKKIYENWSAIKDMFTSVGNSIIDMVNSVLPYINKMLSALSYVGIDIGPIGPIPGLKNGGVLESGTAIVGDGGKPEMIKHTSTGTVVTPLPGGKTGQTAAGGGNAALIAALQENTAAVKSMLNAMGSGGGDIVLTMDEREFGRAVGKVNKNQNSLRFRYS